MTKTLPPININLANQYIVYCLAYDKAGTRPALSFTAFLPRRGIHAPVLTQQSSLPTN
jgi:hypothetical protein